MEDIKELKKRSKVIDPILRIGKNGLNNNVYTEVEKLLKRKKLIKIKILNNCPVEDREEIIKNIVNKSKALLVSNIGNVFTIYRERKP